MRTLVLSVLSLGALTSAALAEQPLTLMDEQMDKVTAGAVDTNRTLFLAGTGNPDSNKQVFGASFEGQASGLIGAAVIITENNPTVVSVGTSAGPRPPH
jgi:hypothetical protein